jgi:hypothetical protein
MDPDGLGVFKVWCDMQNDGGGWTVFQKRQDARADFHRGWQDYKNGFGDYEKGNFWLGLDKIQRLTQSDDFVLKVNLLDFENKTAYAEYGKFFVASEDKGYGLSVGGYSGEWIEKNIITRLFG